MNAIGIKYSKIYITMNVTKFEVDAAAFSPTYSASLIGILFNG